MSKRLLCAIALSGFAATAQAADLDLGSMKDPIPDNMSWKGVTFYGTIDVGLAYATHSAKADAFNGTGINEMMFGNAPGNKSVAVINPNNLEQSKLGLKVEEKLGYGLTAIGQLEMGFIPTTGNINDGCKSVQDRNGVPTFNQLSSGDSSRCGQAFGGPAYAGLSSASYGTLTFGRQNTLALDVWAKYDPQALSYAASILGYTGSLSGSGATETGRWDDSVKYVYQYGPVHAAAMYTAGGPGTATFGDAYGFSGGFEYKGLSIDAFYEKERGVVNAGAFGFSTSTTPTASACYVLSGNQVCPNGLSGTISDDSSFGIAGKYSFMLGGGGYKDGGYKDEYVPGGKVTLYAGAERIIWDNPHSPATPNTPTIGGYILYTVNNTNYGTSQIRDLTYGGVKYEWGQWTATAAYYHWGQNDWLRGATNDTCATQTAKNVTAKAAGTFFGDTVGANCAGNFNLVSGVLDYAWTKHFDQYLIVNYSDANGGFANGFLQHNNTTVITGLRLKF